MERTGRRTITLPFVCALSLALAGGGCAFGPRALEQTHGRYNEAVKQVFEEQALLNLVRLRYNDTTLRLDVASIAAQYELSAGAEARPFFLAPNPSNSNVIFKTFTAILPDALVSASNRPTVSLTLWTTRNLYVVCLRLPPWTASSFSRRRAIPSPQSTASSWNT